jgi:hypothetical protein
VGKLLTRKTQRIYYSNIASRWEKREKQRRRKKVKKKGKTIQRGTTNYTYLVMAPATQKVAIVTGAAVC